MLQTHTDPLSRLQLALAGSQLPSCLYQWAEAIHYPEQGAWCLFPLAVKVILVSCIRREKEMETAKRLPNSHSLGLWNQMSEQLFSDYGKSQWCVWCFRENGWTLKLEIPCLCASHAGRQGDIREQWEEKSVHTKEVQSHVISIVWKKWFSVMDISMLLAKVIHPLLLSGIN